MKRRDLLPDGQIRETEIKSIGGGDVRLQVRDHDDHLEMGILRQNALIRREGGVSPNTWGMPALSIPPGHYQKLIKANPALDSSDAREQTQAWRKFFNSPESLPYRLRDKI